jgi:hypothetical protein
MTVPQLDEKRRCAYNDRLGPLGNAGNTRARDMFAQKRKARISPRL